jgi:hypothetical protein
MRFNKQIGVAISGDENDIEIFRIDIDLAQEHGQQLKVSREEVSVLVDWLNEYLAQTKEL